MSISTCYRISDRNEARKCLGGEHDSRNTNRSLDCTNTADLHTRFREVRIEYCCGGRKALAEACAVKDIDVDTVIAALEAAARNEKAGVKHWTKESLANLTKHILATHHAYCKDELPRLSGLP